MSTFAKRVRSLIVTISAIVTVNAVLAYSMNTPSIVSPTGDAKPPRPDHIVSPTGDAKPPRP